MKQKKLLALLLAVCMVLALMPTVAAADDVVCYTLDGTITDGTNGYATESEITQNDLTWIVIGNTTIDPWRIGGKNLTGENRPIYSTIPMNETITKVEVDIGTITLTKVNSLTLIVADDSAFANVIFSNTAEGITNDSTYQFTPDDGHDWTNAYYKFVFNVTSGSSNQYVQFKAARFYKGGSGDTPQPTTYTVSFDANGGTGIMADVTTTSPYKLPTCAFTAPEGQEFDYWAVDGDEGMYAPGDEYELTGDTTFVAQWKDIPVPTYTDMMLKRVPGNEDVVVIYYPATSKVMTGTDKVYNNKHELESVAATLTDDTLAVPDEALRLTVTTTVADDGKTTLYTFATEDSRYLLADGTHVQLVDEQGANTLFQLEPAAAGTDNWYIKCDSATYGGKAQYIEFYSGYFTVYSFNSSNTPIFTFQFFSESGEGPTPAINYIVSFDPGEGSGEMEDVTDATSPYTLPECTFTAPEGMVFNGWMMAGGDGTVYKAGAQVTLEEPNVTFIAQWKVLVTKNYTLVTSVDELAAGDTVIVVGVNNNKAYALAQQWTNNRRAVEITLDGDQAVVDVDLIATEKVDEYLVRELTIGGNAEGGWTFYDPLEPGYLHAVPTETGKNFMRTQETNDEYGMFTMTFGEAGAIVAVSKGTTSYPYFRFNSSGIFSCYAENSTVQNPIYLYKFVEEEPITEPVFKTQSLTLDGKIGVNFYMDLSMLSAEDLADPEKTYMTFDISGKGTVSSDPVPVSENQMNSKGTYYGFTCYVTSIQMADTITATFHYGDGLTVEKTYSIKEYIETFHENESQYDNETVDLVHALADYGHYTQLYLADAKGLPLGGGDDQYMPMDTCYYSNYDCGTVAGELALWGGYAIDVSCSDTNIRSVTYSVVLDSDTTIRVVLKPVSGFTGDLEVNAGNGNFTVPLQSKRWTVEIPNIPAHLLGDAHTIRARTDNSGGDNWTTCILIRNLSVMSYVQQVMLNGNGAAQNAGCALYYYWQAAKAFKEA